MSEITIQLPPESCDRFHVGVGETVENGIDGLVKISSGPELEAAMDKVLADQKISRAEVDSFERLDVSGCFEPTQKVAAAYRRLLRGQLGYAQRELNERQAPNWLEKMIGLISGNGPKPTDEITYMGRDRQTLDLMRHRSHDYAIDKACEAIMGRHRDDCQLVLSQYKQCEYIPANYSGYQFRLTPLGRQTLHEWEGLMRDRLETNGNLDFDIVAAFGTWLADDKGWGTPPALKPWQR